MVMDVQVELRIKAMQPVLIPGPIGARCVTVDHLQLDLGSVNAPPPLDHRLPGVDWSDRWALARAH